MPKASWLLSTLIFNIVVLFSAEAQTQISPKYSVDGAVIALATKGDTLIVGGSFGNVGIYTGAGALFADSSDKPNLNFPKIVGSVYASTPDGNGGYYIHGTYRRESEPSNAASSRIDHIMPDLSFDPAFSLSVDASSIKVIVYNSGVLYIGGNSVNKIGGQTVGDLSAINVNTQLPLSWMPHIDSGGNIACIAINQNMLYVAGNFQKIGGQLRNEIAAIDLNTGFVKPWFPLISSGAYSDIKFYKNKVILGGNFNDGSPFGGHACSLIDTLIGDSVNYIFNSGSLYWAANVGSMAINGDTLFTSSAGTFDTRITAIDLATGNNILWTKYFNNTAGFLHTTMGVINGSLFFGGDEFSKIYKTDSDNTNSANIEKNVVSFVCLDTKTGNLSNWNPAPGSGGWDTYTISASGSNVFIGGVFSLMNYLPHTGVVMIKTSTDQVLPFYPFKNDTDYPTVNNLKLIDSTLYLAGQFNTIGGVSYPTSVISFNVNTGQLLLWQPANLGNAWTIEADTRNVYLGGSLTEPTGGSGRTNLFAIDRQTGNLASWSPNPNATPNCLYIGNGNLYVGGDITSISGQSRLYLVAYDTTTLSLTPWIPSVASGPSTITGKDSIVWVAGSFYDTSFIYPYINYFAGISAKTGKIIEAPDLTTGATINSLTTNGIYVVAGGKFSDTTACSNILMYNTVTKTVLPPTSFCQSFDDLENGINTMAFIGNDLYFGGSFTDVDSKVNAPNLGRLRYATDFFQNIADSVISYYPHSGGNGGDVTINFQGQLIHPGMRIKLAMAGAPDINSVDSMTYFPATNEMNVTLDLRQKALGAYDVIIIDSNGTQYTYAQGFTIDTTIAPKLWVNVTGDPVLRIGFNQVYTVTFGNDGNVDANFIPLLITNSSIGTNIDVISPLYNIDSIPGFDTSYNYDYFDSTRYTIDDSESNLSFRIFYLTRICANSSSSINLIFHLPANSILHSYSLIGATIGVPLPDSSSGVFNIQLNRETITGDNSNVPYVAECLGTLVKTANDEVDDFLSDAQKNCINGLLPEYANSFRYLLEKPIYYFDPSLLPTVPTNTKDFIDAANRKVVADCGLTLAAQAAVRARATSKILKAIKKSLSTAFDVGSNCSKGDAKDYLSALIGNAWDPNEKYGSGDSVNGFYLNTEKPISYTINFENNPTANLNAQTITVIDSLNASYFDYSAFRFTSIVFSDSVYALNQPTDSFTHDFDLIAQYGVKARVTGTFDTITGVAQWKFQSIDPATNLPTTIASQGILPPDTTSPLGQGYVSCIVRPNKNIGNGGVICNQATIVFDNNPPITTHCWQNIFDLISPVSKVDSLPPVENNQTFNVSWKGSDNLSGIRSYDVYVSVNDNAYTLWLSNQTVTTDTFTGQFGNKYSFYSIATDKAGNVEATKTNAEATTKLININDVLVYPNPNYGSFTVDVNTALKVKDIALFDIVGKRINITSTGANNMFNISINGGGEAFGMYILRIETTQKVINRKIVIE